MTGSNGMMQVFLTGCEPVLFYVSIVFSALTFLMLCVTVMSGFGQQELRYVEAGGAADWRIKGLAQGWRFEISLRGHPQCYGGYAAALPSWRIEFNEELVYSIYRNHAGSLEIYHHAGKKMQRIGVTPLFINTLIDADGDCLLPPKVLLL